MAINKKRRKSWIIFLSIVVLIVIIRIILPFIVLNQANKTLASMDGYYGHIDDIDLHIYRGAYVIKDIYIDKLDSVSNERVAFISSRLIDLSVEWKSLFQGRVVGELEFTNPMLRFTKDKVEPEAIQKDTTDFRNVLESLMPLKVNHIQIIDGKIQFIDSTSDPKIDIAMTNVHVMAENLSNVQDSALLPSTITASAHVYKGDLQFKMRLDALANDPTFDLNAELSNTDLTELNDFLKAYAKFDVSAGTFGLSTEVASKEGKFVGYVKPVIKNLKVTGQDDRHDSFLNKLYEGIVDVVGVILKNPKEKQVATKIPIEGVYGETTLGTWYAVVEVLRNAFIQALYPAIDNEITILSVDKVEEEKKGFFERLFTSDKKDNDKDKKNSKNKENKKD